MEWKVKQTAKEVQKCRKLGRLTRKISSNKSIAGGRHKKGEINVSPSGEILTYDPPPPQKKKEAKEVKCYFVSVSKGYGHLSSIDFKRIFAGWIEVSRDVVKEPL